jgi:hypothetical protein
MCPNVGDAHRVVVDRGGEVVGGKAVGLDDDAIGEHRVLELALTDDDVVPEGHALVRRAQAPGAGTPRGHARRDRGLVQPATMTVVAVPVAAGGPGRLGASGEILLRAEAAIDLPGLLQRGERLAVDRQALALGVRTVRTCLVRPLVPVQTEPAQAAQDGAQRVLGAALLVRVLDAQHEDALLAAGVQPVEECGAGAADVQIAGRARSEADADLGLGHGIIDLSQRRRGAARLG